MNPRPIRVVPKIDHTLEIEFANQEVRMFDMKPHLDFGVFQELKDTSYFLQAKVEHGTVTWPHEQDICPDTLYEDSMPIDKRIA
jgi:Protein of unknown function (DUF2442)